MWEIEIGNPTEETKNMLDGAAEQQKQAQEKILETNFNKINDQIVNNPEKINKISKKSLNTVMDYIKANPQNANIMKDNITKAFANLNTSKKDRKSLTLLKSVIDKVTESKIPMMEKKVTTSKELEENITKKADDDMEKKVNEGITKKEKKLNNNEVDKSAKKVEKKEISEIWDIIYVEHILEKIKNKEQRKYNFKSENFKKSITSINKVEPKWEKVNELIKLLNDGDISEFQNKIYEGDKKNKSYSLDKNAYDWKIWKNSFIKLQEYLKGVSEKNIESTEDRTDAGAEKEETPISKKEIINSDIKWWNKPTTAPKVVLKDIKQNIPKIKPRSSTIIPNNITVPDIISTGDTQESNEVVTKEMESNVDKNKPRLWKMLRWLKRQLNAKSISTAWWSRWLNVVLQGAIDNGNFKKNEKYVFVKEPIENWNYWAANRLIQKKIKQKQKDWEIWENNLLNSKYSKENTMLKITDKRWNVSLVKIFKKPEKISETELHNEKVKQADLEWKQNIAEEIDKSEAAQNTAAKEIANLKFNNVWMDA